VKSPIRMSGFLVALFFSATQLGAQGIYLGLRGDGAFPTGAFSDPATTGSAATFDAAKSGFGYGLDAGLQIGIVGVYASFDHINFDCESRTCNSDGKYKLQGATAGVKLLMPGTSIVRPFVKGGVTFNQLEGGYGSGQSTELKTERKPGYEVGLGLDIGILGLVSFTPQARYIGQNFKYNVPGVNTTGAEPTQGVNYYTFDLGLSVHNPLSGMKMKR
jgi:hypothetical protein